MISAQGGKPVDFVKNSFAASPFLVGYKLSLME
jgi:hypothetical protein